MKAIVVTVLAAATLLSTPALLHAQADMHSLVLELTCRVASNSNQTDFHVMLRNDSDLDTAVVVGVAVGNGRVYLPSRLSLRSTTPAGEERFDHAPLPPFRVGGRVDPWLVPLPKGATYSLSVPTTHFWNISSGYIGQRDRIVRLVLEARPVTSVVSDMEGMRLWRAWTGELASAPIKLPADCR